jgi:outer membrane protein TolC
MKFSVGFSNATRRKRVTAIGCGILLLLFQPSCGIPKLRPPLPAQPLPPDNGPPDSPNSAQVSIEEFYADPLLTGLIRQGLGNNLELKILTENIQITGNEILARRGAYLPFLAYGGPFVQTTKPSLYTPEGAVDHQLFVLPGVPFPDPVPNFMIGNNLFWQIDIWRQLRNARDAAALRFLSNGEARNYLVTRVVADIAENYYRLIAADKRMENLNTIIALQEQSLKFAEARKAQARGTELAVQRFLAEVRKNQSEKLIVQQQIIETENRINFLAGRFPQRVERRNLNFIDLALHPLALGVPSQLLQNRPDIRQAERVLAATGLDIKVARARFYPVLAITGGVGYSAFNPRYLLITPEALIGNIAANAIGPLINKMAIKADFMTANARQLQALYDYQRTVLNAFTEVVTRVNKVVNYQNSIEIKKRQVLALEASVDNATKLFQAARVEYMDVLFAQRDLLDARRVLIDTKEEQLAAVVNTYQALGGGNLNPAIDWQGPQTELGGMFHNHFRNHDPRLYDGIFPAPSPPEGVAPVFVAPPANLLPPPPPAVPALAPPSDSAPLPVPPPMAEPPAQPPPPLTDTPVVPDRPADEKNPKPEPDDLPAAVPDAIKP